MLKFLKTYLMKTTVCLMLLSGVLICASSSANAVVREGKSTITYNLENEYYLGYLGEEAAKLSLRFQHYPEGYKPARNELIQNRADRLCKKFTENQYSLTVGALADTVAKDTELIDTREDDLTNKIKAKKGYTFYHAFYSTRITSITCTN